MRAVLLLGVLGALCLPAAERPNFVLIVSDDQGYADISCYDHPPEVSTPHLDRIAQEGARMTNGYASCPVCSPTRAGLLTGRYQQRFGFYQAPDSRTGLPTSERTLADLLRAAGYATAVFGKWHLGYDPAFRPLRRGFDEFYGFLGHGGHDFFDLSLSGPVTSIYRNDEPIADQGYLTRNLTREAVSFVERRRDEPFFLYLPYNAVHNPIQAPAEVVERFDAGDAQRNTYLAMLAVMDEGVGAVLEALDRHGLADNTLVLFFSDNGGARGTSANNGKLRDYKHSVYEGGIRVPFLARWPARIPAGRVVDEPVISIDAFQTILTAAGVEPPGDRIYDSRDIMLALRGELEGPLHEALFWNWTERDSDRGWAVRKGRWKLVSNKGETELFDLETDLSETRDLAIRQPETVRELRRDYEAWRDAMAPRMARRR
ncbi:MAG: sulfatase-like hydrolase/transferase [Acidobacteria bacterium]|nr:sulfatase-like hydrolase/transferase [Acidobacteriota bacterium]